ncbi:MAG: hypothetical protein A3F12_07780 [Gammaproteobacteria bacterium RIFCSPHIGHO2_12_FULL_38_14]|nr:MAG: hypothetical protein A3F12_07780 [Gammaproteobacteria bacterium RIFCSPHIGHO2_12_FULL_38_14]
MAVRPLASSGCIQACALSSFKNHNQLILNNFIFHLFQNMPQNQNPIKKFQDYICEHSVFCNWLLIMTPNLFFLGL